MKHFGKGALAALLVTILVGALVGCDALSQDKLILESITITSRPTKTTYIKGEGLDLSGLVVTGTYSDGTTRKETVSLANISGYDTNTVSQQTLTVTVDGKTATFTVTVNPATLSSIAVTTPPTKTTYTVGEELDLSGLVVTGTYSDNTTKAETVTIANVSGYDKNTVGGQELTVTVNGKTTKFTVTVNAVGAPTLTSIAVTTPPTKTTYTVGEELDLSGLVVTGTYSDNTTKAETVTTADVNDYDKNTVGRQELTITVNGKTAQFSVTVNAVGAPTLSSIAVTTPPTKTTYTVGEELDLTGLVVTGTYSDDTTKTETVTTADVNGYDKNTVGGQELTVTVNGKTAKFTVTVNAVGAPTLSSIVITTPPAKTTYTVGEELDLSGLVVTGTYSDNTTKAETVTPANVSGYDKYTVGGQELTVTVNGKTAQFSITVNAVGAPTLTSIVVTTPPTKTTYDKGENLDLAGLVITGTYSDGNTKVETVTTADVNGYDKNTVGGQELTVTVNGKTAQFSVTVNADPIDDIADSLANAQGGATAANPVPLAVSVNLANGGWEKILSAIGNTGKYVALDLSACSMTGTEFNPGIGNAGADKVAVLTLPDAAKSIKAGTSYPTYNATFKDFTALESISGAGVETIGNYAFDGCTSLKTVSFSTAITIGEWGFNRCENLASVNLPAVQTLGGSYVFSECVSLTSLSFPSATSIGARAFDQCTSLTEVNLPAAATIGYGAFYYCSSLTSVNLPATPPSIASIGGSGLFAYTGSTGTITVSIPADALRAYTSAWGVTVNTAANGNQYVYGSDHKAVRIPGDAFLQRIEINSLPTKTVYLVGEALDLTGLVVIGIYSDGTTKQETVSLSDVTGYNADEIAEQILTVTVRDKTATLTTTFRVSVNVVIHASINFDNPINGAPENIVLSRAGMPSSITIEITGTYADYEWRLNDNDEPVSRTASYTLNAADCLLGTNFLDVQVRTTAGAYYSKEITFTVNR